MGEIFQLEIILTEGLKQGILTDTSAFFRIEAIVFLYNAGK